jgi:hypothetical protein
MAKRFKGVPNLPFAPIAAVTFGVVFAILAFNTPDWRLERLVGSTGLASVLPAAKPPLGSTARTLVSILTAVTVSGLLWAIMRPIEAFVHRRRVAESRAKARGSFIPAADIEMDANPDWSARAGRSPIFAESELGAPFMSDEALSKGEELLLDSAEMEVLSDIPEDGTASPKAIDLSAWQMKAEPKVPEAEMAEPEMSHPVPGQWEAPLHLEAPVDEPAFEPLVADEPVVLNKPVEQPAMTPPPFVKPLADASLSELMLRLENALDTRALGGKAASDAPLAGNIASLHELIGLQRKSGT